MSDHLPECEMASPQCAGRASGETHRGVMFCLHCQRRCICSALRACEKRVRLEDDDYAYVAAQAEADGRWQGWADALDTAQEAIAALDKVGQGQDYVLGVFDSLSAIETLKHNTSP